MEPLRSTLLKVTSKDMEMPVGRGGGQHGTERTLRRHLEHMFGGSAPSLPPRDEVTSL